jgi:hypothetical protein
MGGDITLREHLQRIAALGGKAAANKLTKKQRSIRAKLASRSRKMFKKK